MKIISFESAQFRKSDIFHLVLNFRSHRHTLIGTKTLTSDVVPDAPPPPRRQRHQSGGANQQQQQPLFSHPRRFRQHDSFGEDISRENPKFHSFPRSRNRRPFDGGGGGQYGQGEGARQGARGRGGAHHNRDGLSVQNFMGELRRAAKV